LSKAVPNPAMNTNNQAVRPVLWYIGGLFALLVAIVGITSFFIYSDILGRTFQSVVNLKVAPAFIGGRIATVLYDPVGDDHGYGGLLYPAHKGFVPGSLDLVRCEVHEPVYDAKWTELRDFWQIDLIFREGGSEDRNIRIYLSMENATIDSRTLPRNEMAEGVSFNPAFPWQYVIAVHGTKGIIESADKTLSFPLYVTSSNADKTVMIRIPLNDRRLQVLYSMESVRLYVLIGGWSPWGYDEFLPVARHAAIDTGGGAVSSLTPVVYDYLAPDGESQEALLSAWNDDELTVPEIQPVTVLLRSAATKRSSLDSDFSGRIAEFEKQFAEKEAAAAENTRLAWQSAKSQRDSNKAMNQGAPQIDIPADLDYATLAFNAGDWNAAESLFDSILAIEPDNPIALAYKGSLVAMRAKEASKLMAVELVSKAYQYLDRAVELARTPTEIITARMNRGNVSMSVPESVFGKSLQGAEDFIAVAAVFLHLTPDPVAYKEDIAKAYLNAARCFESAGKPEDASTWLFEAIRIQP